MPFSSRFSRRRRFTRRPFRRKPKFNKMMRMRQGLARHTFWCVGTGGIRVDTLLGPLPDMVGTINWSIGINDVQTNVTFLQYASIYSQWRCLKMICQFFPSYVGSETTRNNTFIRGNTCTYVDQKPISLADLPQGQMNQVLRNTSAMIIDPRRYGHKRWINRPRTGYDQWGDIDRATPGGGIATTADSWDTLIKMYGDGYPNDVQPPPATTTTPIDPAQMQKYNVFFFKVMHKIQFRSRYGE